MIRAASLLRARNLVAALLVPLAGCGAAPAEPDAGPVTDPPPLDAGRPVIDPPPTGGPRGCGWETEPPAPADVLAGSWDRRFSLPGLGGRTPAATALAALDDGSIVVAGDFTSVGDELPALNIALFSPAGGWSALGEGIPIGVTAVAAAGTQIYAAGRGPDEWPPPPVQGQVYRWTGAGWQSIGGFDGQPQVLVIGEDGALYAGGWFSEVDGVAASNVAVWREASGWSALDAAGPDSEVSAIVADAGGVCIGGGFGMIGDLPAVGVACLEDGTWRAYSLPEYGGVQALARDPSDGALVAGGHFPIEGFDSDAGGSIARWAGDRWELIGGGLHGSIGPGYVEGVEFVDGVLHVGGSFLAGGRIASSVPLGSVAAFRDGAWDDLDGGVHKRLGVSIGSANVLSTTVDAQGRFVAGGLFSLAGTQSVIGVAAWDGAYWRGLGAAGAALPGGINGNVEDIAAMGSCALYVAGTFEYAGDVRANNVARFDFETGWHPVGEGLPFSVVQIAVTDRVPAVGPDAVEGATLPIGGPHGALYAAQLTDLYEGFLVLWDGQTWREMGAFDAPIFAIAVAEDGSVVVGGDFTRVGDQPAMHVARWDGYGWRPLESGVGGSVRALHFLDDGRLLVGGSFTSAGGAPAGGAAVWDGAGWTPLGEGLEGSWGGPPTVDTFAVLDGDIVAGGGFVGSDGRAMENIARFDGTDWQPIDAGLPGLFVNDVRVVGGTLIAAGHFELDGGEHTIAALIDGAWRPFESDTDDLIMAIEARPEGLYFAGPFVNAAERPSVGLALFRYEVSE